MKKTDKHSDTTPTVQGYRYVALLRGVNVGGNRVIKNTEFKECFEALGLANVTVILQSGNIVFESKISDVAKLTKLIEQGLGKRFNYPAKAIVKDIPAVEQVIKKYPFDHTKPDHHNYVVFVTGDIQSEMINAATLNPNGEQIAPGKSVIYWQVKKGITLESSFGKLSSKAKYKDFCTTRNINTLHKIVR